MSTQTTGGASRPRRDAVVTGGASGMGRAVCERLAYDGLVGVLDRNAAGARETVELIEAAGNRAVALEADVSDGRAVEAAFAEFEEHGGVPEVVVACAGVERVGTVATEPEENWDFLMDINAKGVYLAARSAFARFVPLGRGSFIAISSDAGVAGAREYGVYCASKHAVVGLIRCLALDFGHLGIRSNVLCPGTFRTPMLDEYIERYGDEGFQDWASTVPLGRIGETVEIANAVAFLASPDASYVNGTTYVIDGAATAGSYFEPVGQEASR